MSLTVTIDGVDRTARVILNSIEIQQALTSTVDTCTFALRLPAAAEAEIPDFTHEVIITLDASRLFGGVVTTTNPTLGWGGDEITVEVACQDFQYHLTRTLIADAFQNESAGSIVRSILTTAGTPYGITEGTIENGPTIEEFKIDYEEAGQAIERLAEITGFEWYVDALKRLYFFSPSSAVADAPWELDIPAAGVEAASAPITSLRAPRDGTQYRNAITLRGAQSVSDTRTDTRTSSGVEREYVTSFPLVVPGSLTLTIAGVPQTVGVTNVDDPSLFDWMVNYAGRQDNLATITANAGTTTPANGAAVVMEYRHFTQVIVQAQDDAAILERGRFEHIIIREEIDTRQLASVVAQAELARWSRPADVLAYQTTRPGLRAGMRQQVTVPQLAIDAEYLIRSVRVSVMAYAPEGMAFQAAGYALRWDVEGERV